MHVHVFHDGKCVTIGLGIQLEAGTPYLYEGQSKFEKDYATAASTYVKDVVNKIADATKQHEPSAPEPSKPVVATAKKGTAHAVESVKIETK